MNNPIIEKLVDTAWHLAAIQIEGIVDHTGFSGADKNVGAHLAAAVQADPSDMDSVVALAALVGVKYQRQTLGIVGPEVAANFKALGKGGKLTPEQRSQARMTVIAQPDVHEKFGARLLLSFQYVQAFAYALKELKVRAFNGPDGWKWAVPVEKVDAAVAALKAQGARIVGSLNVDGIAPAPVVKDMTVHARMDGRKVVVWFKGYDAKLIEAIKAVPSRKYDSETREWRISGQELSVAVENFKLVGANVDELLALAPHVPQAVRPVEVKEPEVSVDANLLATAKAQYQVDGVNWLVQSLEEARKETFGASTIRGLILGDKMGLGKTWQAEIAAKSILETMNPDGHVLVVCPATPKVNWEREIHKFCGAQETVHILDGQNGPDLGARWNIVNFDILKQWYDALVDMGFDVLIIDEAHYIKNREAERSRLVVGGKVSFPAKISAKELAKLQQAHEKIVAEAKAKGDKAPKFKHPMKLRRVEGLAANAKLRVFPLTGTPLANRPKDVFNLLRAIGHPLGKNFREFGMRYCDPQANSFGTEFKGASNLSELRERIDSVFLQRFNVPGLPELMRTWTPVEVDLTAYRAVMADYYARRKAGLLSSTQSHLALLGEAKVCAAVAKVQATIQRIESALEGDEKVIVFSSYARCIREFTKHFGDMAVVLDGSKSQKQRNDAIDRFQNDPSVKVFIGQTQAAGVAITLTAATQVKFNDPDWVPANLLQAEKRAHRIGQNRTVFVEYVLAAGTFDEEMAVLLEEKMEQVNEFEGTDESLFLELVARLNAAPQNAEAKALWTRRERGEVPQAA